MLKSTQKHHLLLIIFTFAFIYRLLLMFRDGYPPGADIGLHNSVIYSITGSGNVDLFYNYYHMGGGLSLTFPGYHIFTANIMLMTGLPEYIAHAVIVSLFSALIILIAFLITKRVWSEPAAFIVAFLAAISRFDIEMLLWAGYPNVITLLLIPLTFYLYLQKDRFSTTPFLIATSILAGSIFLTHSLSAALYVAITVLVVLFIAIKPKMLGTTRKKGLYWLLPIVFGAIIFAPFVIQAVPQYLNNNSTLSDDPASSDAIKLATIATRMLPLELVLPLFGVLAGYFVFSKKFFGRPLYLPTFLLSIWVLVPLVLTQGYLVGVPVDYNRFLYFLILPFIIFIAVLIEYGSSFFAKKIDNYKLSNSTHYETRKLKLPQSLTKKHAYSSFVLLFLVFSFIALPIFMSPAFNIVGIKIQEFYQTMDDQGWEAIQWAKAYTPTDSVFVSDALYGWWFGGFAQRRTYSAVDPQYLSINEEYNKTLFARNLLDTDYLVDNGLIQVREDGGYIARHNPQILAKLNWTYFPYTFFVFAGNETTIEYYVDGKLQSVALDMLSVKEMRMEAEAELVTIDISRGNEHLNYTQTTTIYKGSRFVNLTTAIDSTFQGFSLSMVNITVQTKGDKIQFNDNRIFGLLDEPVKVIGQLVFPENQPILYVGGNNTQRLLYLEYNFEGRQSAGIEISASAFSVSDDLEIYKHPTRKESFLNDRMSENLNPNRVIDDTKGWEQIFDYRTEIQRYNVSYIACRFSEMFPKFLRDSSFSLVFFNNGTIWKNNIEVINEIAIFKVNGNLK